MLCTGISEQEKAASDLTGRRRARWMCISLWMALSAVVLHPGALWGDVLSDASGEQWAGYGRTYDESHFSPLAEINTSNVAQLGLAWWFDIPGVVQASSVPLEVSGTLYFATGYSVIRAVDALSGRLLWKYDPGVT